MNSPKLIITSKKEAVENPGSFFYIGLIKNTENYLNELKKQSTPNCEFFSNTQCEYFPCHKGVNDFNCLFCYCPLYHKDDCGGSYIKECGVKDCSNCSLPHERTNYSKILSKI